MTESQRPEATPPSPDPSRHDRPAPDAPQQPSQHAASAEAQPAATRAAGDPDETSRLEAELATLKAKSGEMAEQYLRAKAELENVRRRADEEVAKTRKFALEAFAESLLPVLDSLEAGLAIREATAQQLREGSEATLRQLMAALARNKVVAIDPRPGERFDPNLHHAISIAPAAQNGQQLPPNSIAGVLQRGYLIAERVLRPALVTVSAPS